MSEEVWAELYDQRAATRENRRRLGEMAQRLDDALIQLALLKGRSVKTIERVERLESIILTVARGTETSYPDREGQLHTHSSYPTNGARDLINELRDFRTPSGAGDQALRDPEDQQRQNDPVARQQAELDDPHYNPHFGG